MKLPQGLLLLHPKKFAIPGTDGLTWKSSVPKDLLNLLLDDET